MYKLIIVDDETAIRRGMCNYIPWNEMGFEVIADFEDGKETIEYINENQVDVIITDIEMAEVTGLDLTEYIHNNKMDIKVVILSGYKLFEYAKKALEFKVEHYLLKPIHMEEVKEVFAKIKQELDDKKKNEQMRLDKQKDFEAILVELQEQFFISLLVGGIQTESSIKKRSKHLQLDLQMDVPYAILGFSMNMDENSNGISFFEKVESKDKLMHSMFGNKNEDIKYYISNLASNVTKIIAVSAHKVSSDEFEKSLREQIKEKTQAAKRLFELEADINIDQIFTNMKELLEYKYTLQMHAKVEEKDYKLLDDDYQRLMQKYKLLIEIINDGDFEALDSLVENIFNEFRNLPLDYVKHLTIDMFSLLSAKFIKMGIDLMLNVEDSLIYQSIMEIKNASELKNKSKEILERAVSILDSTHNDVTKSVVSKAKNI